MVSSVFAEVCFLTKQFKAAITPGKNIWDIIAIVVALNSLYNDFEPIIASMLESKEKSIEEIYQILASAKAKLKSIRVTRIISDLAMILRGPPKTATSKDI